MGVDFEDGGDIDIVDLICREIQRIKDAPAYPMEVPKYYCGPVEAADLRSKHGDKWFDAHCVEIGPLPVE